MEIIASEFKAKCLHLMDQVAETGEELIITKSSLPPHECYIQVIMPYKGELELWYHKNQSFTTDLLLLMLTIWYIFNPGSKLVFKVFKDLPQWKVQVT